MPEYSKHRPEPEPTRHTYRLTEDEVIRAIEWWLVAQGHSLPDGRKFVWGLEHRYRRGGGEPSATLVIDETPPA